MFFPLCSYFLQFAKVMGAEFTCAEADGNKLQHSQKIQIIRWFYSG